MILPTVRDPRLVTVRRGGSLTDDYHHLLALWAAECRWQRDRLPDAVRSLVLEDQERRNGICWSVFD